MKRIILLSVLSILLAFALPLIFARGGQSAPDAEAEITDSAHSQGEVETKRSIKDGDINLSVLLGDEVQQMSMAEYLPMALAGEMPASFQPEALKAQAVALRSYILYMKECGKSAHPEATVCANSGCCTAAFDEEAMKESWGESFETYYEKILAAVADTDGQYLCYAQEPILAVFHSCSSGFTEAGENVWSAQPYLLSVESPETGADVRSFLTTVEVSPTEFRTAVLRSFPNARLEGSPETWLGEVTPNSSGRVGSIVVGTQEISGLAMRQIFSLRSTDFTLEYNGQSFLFSVEGYGHGVGMSQYGANVMASRGAAYHEILSHYYPGTELVVTVEVVR